MKIIDTHVHIGRHGEWDFPGELLLAAMNKVSIGFGLVSSVSGGEFLGDREFWDGGNQIVVNDEVKTFVLDHPERFKGLFWIRPHLEGYTQEIEDYLSQNRSSFVGLKVHPSESRLAFTSEPYRSYLNMCARLKLPVAVHTEDDGYANPAFLYETAKRFPDVNLVMVHMGMRTDHRESIRYIRELPNLYGDTTFVDAESVLLAIRECGSHKILFGSDAPALGIDIYDRYRGWFQRSEAELSPDDRNNIFFANAEKLFGL